jgi:hypothetical protein
MRDVGDVSLDVQLECMHVKLVVIGVLLCFSRELAEPLDD